MTWKRMLVMMAAMVAAGQAAAADCAGIADRAARLDCYDRAAQGGAPAARTLTEAPKQKASGRCQGITKKGAQCKRNAKAGGSYCYQHGR